MILRNVPVILDKTKFVEDQTHERMYQRLLMYRHWSDEKEFLGNAEISEEACRILYEQEKVAIDAVAEGLRRLLLNLM